ncbi:MAG: hypothetical protein HG450_003470 [Clostridiales bacterium]|nr:hypothetical protein [Clostridiales bacterium]
MESNILYIIMGITLGLLAIIVVAYLKLRKKMQNSDVKRINSLINDTKEKRYSLDVFYQKLYIKFQKAPFIKRYLYKIRRRLEINNLDDEYLTRMQTAKIIFRAVILVTLLTIGVVVVTHNNLLLMGIILIFELFIIDTLTDSMVDKIDNNLLLQQIDFFAALRHSYHETNMVGEAIYVTAQDTDAVEVSRQAEKIFEILNSSDPETELEKYYDVAPNNYLKEFAGISFLTQEFGDRKVNGESLYLKNLENITQEMQLEILKRDKLDYTFKSISVISIVPVLFLEPLKNWATNNFGFTVAFYEGKSGMLVQLGVILLTIISYIMIRKLKDNGSVKRVEDTQNPWQEKLYKNKLIKKVVDMFMPKQHTAQERKEKRLLQDAASKQKLHWLYVSRLAMSILAFIGAIITIIALHAIQVNFQYTNPTSDYDLIGTAEGGELKKAKATTERQNKVLDKLKGPGKTVDDKEIKKVMSKIKDYDDKSDTDIKKEIKQIKKKLNIINKEYISWVEILIAFVVGYLGYMAPYLIIKFQVKLRIMEMEDEVMQYQVIILMLMRLERVDVEMILEWLDRYADIFKEQISKCLNNYESGAYEALEEMKEEVTYQEFIRIIESLQSAVEKVPIKEAFEELESDRDYYRDKRKETNARLIDKKGRIGKAVGFAPMVVMFVGYLIFPLMYIGMTSMSSVFTSLQE